MRTLSSIVVGLIRSSIRLVGPALSALAALAFPTWGQFEIDWPDLEDVVPYVINPIGALSADAASPVARGLGLDPDQVRTIVNPIGRFSEHAPEMISAAGQAELDRINSELMAVTSLLTGDLDRLERSAGRWVNAYADKTLNSGVIRALQPLMSPIVPWFLRDTFMDRPHLTLVNREGYGGDPVYYVNGMDTSFNDACDESAALGDRLQRPVLLLYNDTRGTEIDLAEAIYDRLWPFMPQRFVQGNPVTRELTSLLFHSEHRLSIVTHSQGCLIMRNALLTANSFSGGRVRGRVAWVATGIPLRDDEVYPRCARFRSIANDEDPIAQVVGLRVDLDAGLRQDLGDHSFARSYVRQISSSDVWPTPVALFEKVDVRHNLLLPGTFGATRGMSILINLSIEGVRNEDCMVVAYFQFPNGRPLLDYGGGYRTADGQVATGTSIRPRYDSTEYTNLQMTIPYEELHMARGRYDVEFVVEVYIESNQQHIGQSRRYPFVFTAN